MEFYTFCILTITGRRKKNSYWTYIGIVFFGKWHYPIKSVPNVVWRNCCVPE